MSIRVANIWKLHRVEGETRVYVGRACRGYEESALANPFRSKDLPGGKEEAISLYREWLAEKTSRKSPQSTEILDLARRSGNGEHIVLMCWCHPAACHANVIIEKVAEFAHQNRCLGG